MPLEPIHVHIASGKTQKDATKIWLTQAGHCVLANNRSKIPENILKNIMRMIEVNWEYIREEWLNMFGEIRYYC